jgi:uncharacterized protein YbjT (DUF2867 family)
MELTIFGATGKTGVLLVERALADGHHVRAFVRSPGKLTVRHDRLEVVPGELTDAAGISQAVKGADAVLSVLGPPPKAKGTPLTEGMRLIVAAMQEHHVGRLVAVSTPSVNDPHDSHSLKRDLMVGMVKRLAGSAYADITGTADVVRASDLDWTLVRVQLLTDRPPTGKLAVGHVGDGTVKTLISRGAIVAFVLEQLTDRSWVRRAPLISNG